ncbi:MAG: T9SS type A sorting domain-containing protein [Bacteroidetes bacterium]|nr:T9SS type A sorting domain-containing protein [Bacteroidota bacterium]
MTFPSNTTGMQTIRKNERLIYPVPSSGIVNVQGGSAGDVIIISDLTGKLLQKYIADSSTIQMNLSHLTNGYYLVNIFDKDQKIYNGKIIIAGN